MSKESETTGLSDGRKWWLAGNATDVGISDNKSRASDCPGFFAGIQSDSAL